MAMNSAGRQVNGTGTPGVIARPPLLFLAALLLGFVLDHPLSLPFPVARIGSFHWISAIIAGFLILTGIAAFAVGIRNFSSAATPVQGTKPTQALVTTGIHGWSRNPIYLGMFLVYGRHRLSRTQPVDPDPRATARINDPLWRRGARGGLLATTVRRRLPRLQGPRASLALAHRTAVLAKMIVAHLLRGIAGISRRPSSSDCRSLYAVLGIRGRDGAKS